MRTDLVKQGMAQEGQVDDDPQRQVRYHHALAECALALQDHNDEGAIEKALAALLGATDADYAYVDQNYEDPELGLCTKVIHEFTKPNTPDVESIEEWWFGPYSELPTTYNALSAGETLLVRTADLEGRERQLYEDDGVLTELCLPIHVEGKWWGSVAFADYQSSRDWSPLEASILETAARMFGTFWERRHASEELNSLLEAQANRLRYEKAIAECSKALLMSTDTSAVDQALEQVMDVTGVHNVFVDRNYIDSQSGLMTEVTNEVIRPGFEDVVLSEFWDYESDQPMRPQVAYSDIPTVRDKLARGEKILVIPSELPWEERQIYEADGCLSELNIPIMASGSWLGSIVFVDYLEERRWDDEDDLALLQTVAEMIGVFWERTEYRNQLEEMVRSKDEFVASVSHEIRTPLTSVVGLSNELRDRHGEFDAQESRELISLIADQSNQVADIVSDLLVTARADSGALSVNLRPVAVSDFLDEMMRTRLFDNFDHIQVEGPDLIAVADSGRLAQVIRNLVVNAKRYGGSNLRFTIAQVDGLVSITVGDDGNGVPDEEADRIFEAYRRAHSDSNQPASIGLGLAVARQLTRLMNGEISYTRRQGWTEFQITLPMSKSSRNV